MGELPNFLRQKIAVKRNSDCLTVHRGAMQVSLKPITNQAIEVRYEARLHEISTELVPVDKAVPFLVAIISRKALEPVDSSSFKRS